MKNNLTKVFVWLILSALCSQSFAADGTIEGAGADNTEVYLKPGTTIRATDETYTLTPIESVSTGGSVWTDNRHRAYYGSSGMEANGFLLFDVSTIPDGSNILSMTLRCYLENAFGSPYMSPIVDIYYSADDNWTRYSVSSTSLSHDVLVVNNIPFTSYVESYDFDINVSAHDWSGDLIDNQICFGFKDDVNYYSYVYFFGAYGTPTGPPPELTIVTGTAPVYDIVIDLTYISGSPVPASGGNLIFDAFLENIDTVPADFDAWLDITFAGGAPTTVVQRSFTDYMPGWTVNRPGMWYPIALTYAAGNYTFAGRVGNHPGTVWDESAFPFTKSGVSDGSLFVPFPVDGAPDPFDEIIKANSNQPAESRLLCNYPNPFNPSTTISYELQNASVVNLTVFDLSGRQVAELVNGWCEMGNHQVHFDASNLPSGIYLYRLNAGDYSTNGKMVLMK